MAFPYGQYIPWRLVNSHVSPQLKKFQWLPTACWSGLLLILVATDGPLHLVPSAIPASSLSFLLHSYSLVSPSSLSLTPHPSSVEWKALLTLLSSFTSVLFFLTCWLDAPNPWFTSVPKSLWTSREAFFQMEWGLHGAGRRQK